MLNFLFKKAVATKVVAAITTPEAVADTNKEVRKYNKL